MNAGEEEERKRRMKEEAEAVNTSITPSTSYR